MISHEHHGVLNHWQLDCLFNSLSMQRIKKAPKLCIVAHVRGIHHKQAYPYLNVWYGKHISRSANDSPYSPWSILASYYVCFPVCHQPSRHRTPLTCHAACYFTIKIRMNLPYLHLDDNIWLWGSKGCFIISEAHANICLKQSKLIKVHKYGYFTPICFREACFVEDCSYQLTYYIDQNNIDLH